MSLAKPRPFSAFLDPLSGHEAAADAGPPTRRLCLQAGLALLCGSSLAPAQAARAASAAAPALLLAREASPAMDPRGWLVSEKLDGIRAHWDGRDAAGRPRGGLRFRGGGVVPAPAWFVAALPAERLDGELWLGRGRFEALAATVRDERADDAAWRSVHYQLFEAPGGDGPFAARAVQLQAVAERAARDGATWLRAVAQQSLPDAAALQTRLEAVVAAGGEGLMLHRADAPYLTGRSELLLKLKPLQDDEAEVIAHLPGRGRHAGRLGALLVRDADGRRFGLGTGFSDAQREAPPPVGSRVTYTYRGRTAQGLPRFASFLRVAEPGPGAAPSGTALVAR